MIIGYKRSLSSTYNKKFWQNGYLLLKDFFSLQESQKIISYSNYISNYKDNQDVIINYKNNSKISIENFLNNDNDLQYLINKKINPTIKSIYGENLNISKNVLHYKKPFSKLETQENIIEENCVNVMLFADKFSINSGCIELPTEQNTEWKIIESKPQDILIFNSNMPYRNKSNNTKFEKKFFHLIYN